VGAYLKVSEFVNDNIVDHLRRQLHNAPMKVEGPVNAARPPSETKIHDIDKSGRGNSKYSPPPCDCIIQIRICFARVMFSYSLFTRVNLVTMEKKSITLEAN
jgi:hypothetical protein